MLKLVTPTRALYESECDMAILRSVEGEFGVLPGHESFTTILSPGKLRVFNEEKEDLVAVLGGFVVIDDNKVTILSDQAELPEEIDLERAQAARERAENRLKGTATADDVNLKRAELALRRALVRIDISSYTLLKGK